MKPHVIFGLVAVVLTALTPVAAVLGAPMVVIVTVGLGALLSAARAGEVYLEAQGE